MWLKLEEMIGSLSLIAEPTLPVDAWADVTLALPRLVEAAAVTRFLLTSELLRRSCHEYAKR